MVSRYFLPLLVSNCKFEISTLLPLCPKWLQDNIMILISTFNSNTLPCPILTLVCPKYPGPSQSNSDHSSGYEQILCEKNMQLTELKLYINNIARCLCIVDILSARIQYHQWYTLIKFATLFTSWLSTNHNNIQQASDINQKLLSLYKTNPIFIPHYVSINKYTLRIHW